MLNPRLSLTPRVARDRHKRDAAARVAGQRGAMRDAVVWAHRGVLSVGFTVVPEHPGNEPEL